MTYNIGYKRRQINFDTFFDIRTLFSRKKKNYRKNMYKVGGVRKWGVFKS
jgi:hypothetical protein